MVVMSLVVSTRLSTSALTCATLSFYLGFIVSALFTNILRISIYSFGCLKNSVVTLLKEEKDLVTEAQRQSALGLTKSNSVDQNLVNHGSSDDSKHQDDFDVDLQSQSERMSIEDGSVPIRIDDIDVKTMNNVKDF
jgi:hypothetical protein